MTLKDLAARSPSFDMRLRSLQGSWEPDWERLRIDVEDRPALVRQTRRDSVLWLYGYIVALADKKLIDVGDAERMQCEILDLKDAL
ncbi:hypothetical protein E0E54_10505 [Azotobacter chroococcum]|uniref:hypothetical protein n=1 Tax=Azotobacter chroococcum TaxID=353 RepID=UPI0010399D57|nr:hypothetical protein [Azotobacter chroococcum]MEE4465328.1 hypothetical protein [Azotobacter chroococcum]TBW35856.1 hypothetical protein E0E54_10505 [Azotobacter chroococcum]TKD44744.1 hypothetical protein FCG41_05415 [Azotobacter chroococcum]